ncbi:MAG TPA: M24 family metallopeptidase, partial [Candidatus Polarisedimenticolaceae bacterium]|nr:M24 family metallopeptidase [Candidatus Polarisedimenticolaceae bacterium]
PRDAGLELVERSFAEGRKLYGWEVDDRVRAVVTRGGYGEAFLHRTGHSIGIDDVHGNGANIDNLETKDERMIVPGTCFSIEPGIYLDGRMAVRSEIDVYVRDDGSVEVCGPVQRELIRIGGGER